MLKYGLKREHIEQKLKFMKGLKSNLKSILLTAKANEQFKIYSLAKMFGISRSHEYEILEEVKSIPNFVPLAFVAKADSSKDKKFTVVENDSDLNGFDDEFIS